MEIPISAPFFCSRFPLISFVQKRNEKGKWREGEENLKVKEVKEMKHEIVFQKVVLS